MALIYADRVRETTNTYGTTDTIVLSGADTGYQRFSSVMAIGDTCYFAMVNPNGDWECGRGTLTTVDTLVRSNPPQASSNDDINVDWPAGHTSTIFLTMTAASFEEIRCKQALVTLSQNASTAVTGTAILGVYEPSGVDGLNMCAIMTGNTSPTGYSVAHSNTAYSLADAWRVFDGSLYSDFACKFYPLSSTTTGGSGWISYTFPTTKLITTVKAYMHTNPSYTDQNNRDARIQIYGDELGNGQTWVLLYDSETYLRFGEYAWWTWVIPADNVRAVRGIKVMATVKEGLSTYPETVEITLHEDATVQTLIPGVDYRVAKSQAPGIKSLLVTRLKAGTGVLHTIDYV